MTQLTSPATPLFRSGPRLLILLLNGYSHGQAKNKLSRRNIISKKKLKNTTGQVKRELCREEVTKTENTRLKRRIR
jgi:hypothetical protein